MNKKKKAATRKQKSKTQTCSKQENDKKFSPRLRIVLFQF